MLGKWVTIHIHSNVWEWCQDWLGSYSRDEAIDPTGPSAATFRVYRGGSWGYEAALCRSAYRFWHVPHAPGKPSYFLGFRVARSPSGK